MVSPFWSSMMIWRASMAATLPARSGDHHVTRVDRGAALHAGADQRGLGDHQRHGLTLHVGAHQGAVGVVVLQERDQRRRDRDDLRRRDVHVVDIFRVEQLGLAGAPAQDRADQLALLVHLGVGLRDDLVLFLGRVEPLEVVGDHALLHAPVAGLDEPELVDGRVAAQRADQADVRAFRRLDRAHAPVVGRVHVAHLDRARARGSARRHRAPTGGGGASARPGCWSGP